ncbi:NmrA family transcriptional regulator [Cellulosimicrobium marinum]|uniref:NmrA family transcriptional regulator n=1 Tax=Cellulosimicrobium marinum TaxID=1638992 RepID=UPI001E54E118|nr:NmrA family transcriptional regulator [Cellulosimicrobium marinum]MCB7137645.1 NmrA family transcriptional regulator [Cellulosimicrobium marinum]
MTAHLPHDTSPTTDPATNPATAPTTALGPVLVLGATGKSGRRVADRLDGLDVPVRRASRSGAPGTVPFAWDDESTWRPALDGAQAVYVAYAPDLAVPGAPETVTRLAALAHDVGVRRLVLLSGRGEVEAQRAEAAVAAVFPGRVVVRCAFFAQNVSESFLLDAVLDGTIALPVGDVAEPFVDLEDVAEVAVAALTDDAHAGQVYELTGPRLLTFADLAAEITAASGHEVAFVPIALDEFTAGLTAAGLPGDTVDLLRYLFTEVLDGRGAHVSDGVHRALGREPRDVAEFARREAGAWSRVLS